MKPNYEEAKQANERFKQFLIINRANPKPVGQKFKIRVIPRKLTNVEERLWRVVSRNFKSLITVGELSDDIIELQELQVDLWEKRKTFMS